MTQVNCSRWIVNSKCENPCRFYNGRFRNTNQYTVCVEWVYVCVYMNVLYIDTDMYILYEFVHIF